MTAWGIYRLLLGDIDGTDTVYGRNYYGMFFINEIKELLPKSKRPTLIFEHHHDISAHFKQRFFGDLDGLVCITDALKQRDQDLYGIPDQKCLVAPDGVDLSPYESLSKAAARREIGMSQHEQVVMYTGHLYRGKGVEELIRAAPDIDATVYIVGGYQEDIERLESIANGAANVVFTGFVEPAKIPLYQTAADILIAPYTSDARDFLSPLKLFEYMAAGRPIVASDLNVLGEVLTNGENALLVPPGDSVALADAIRLVLSDDDLYRSLAESVQRNVTQYTWTQRAKNIVSFIDAL